MTVAKRDKLVVGLIGGIGSGKSQVAAAFALRGARVIAGDQLGQAALRDADIRARVADRWGNDVLDDKGEVDRRRLAAIVFADPAELKALAAIMLEAGWNDVCDRLIYIEAPRGVRLERVRRQRGWTEKEVAAREQAQLPLTEKVVRADHVLENSASLEHLDRQVHDLLHLWGLARASTRREPDP